MSQCHPRRNKNMQKITRKHYKIRILFLVVSFLYLMLPCTASVNAETNDSYSEMGDSEEETAYREFLMGKDYSADMGNLDTMMYAVYDVNNDQKKELIIKGLNTQDMHYEYSFYQYKDAQVQLIGVLDNWQNSGNGEMYYMPKGNGIVVNMKLADHVSYTLYQIKDKVEKNFTIHKQSIDVKKFGGNYERQYRYSCEDENGDPLGEKIDDKVWAEFESRMQEIPFYELDSFEETPQYDTVEEENDRQDTDTGEEEKGNQNEDTGHEENADSQEIISPDEISDAVQIAAKVKGLQYAGNQVYNLSLQRDENNYSALYPDMESGILAAFSMDFDGDGDEEIFSVSYDSSAQDGLGKVLHFLLLKKDGESWKITSDQEVVTLSSYGEMITRNCLDGRCVKEEDSVFFRKYKGTYEFFYEEYDVGIIADGQEWFFKGFRLEDGELKTIDETDDLYFTGSPIDQLWENFEGSYSSELEKFCSLGFSSPEVHFENMTADSNDCLYNVLRMVRDTSCSSEVINQWMSNGSREILDGFTCTIEDQTEAVLESIEEFPANSHPISNQSSSEGDSSEYLIPDIASRYISEEEITGFSLDDIQTAINEIFARHGRVFKSAEIAAYFQTKSWYQPDPSKTDDQISAEFNNYEKANEKMLENLRDELSGTTAQQSEDTSFYGIWCYGGKEEGEANSYAETLKASGFDARVYVTTDWSNLNTEKFYVVTAGVYSTESEANAALTSVQSVCPEAYVKYSGNRR